VISPGRLWWLFSRDFKRGWEAAYHDYKTLPRIEDWSWPFATEPPMDAPVHVLTGAQDWRLAAWMLASWFEASERNWAVDIHDDGTLPKQAQDRLLRLFPHARIITRAEADAAMSRALRAFPFCWEYRQMHPLGLKIFDVPHFSEGTRFLLFDSDVLFFRHPREILDWVVEGRDECWFNEDITDATLLTAAEAKEDFGIRLWQRVNSGLCLIHKPAINYDLIDRVLAQTSVMRGKVWRIEQTLYALCASMHGKGGLLPRRYEVSLHKHAAEDAVARHYVGAVRDRFFAEGIKRLRDQLFPIEPK
jgi:hypothetical protein